MYTTISPLYLIHDLTRLAINILVIKRFDWMLTYYITTVITIHKIVILLEMTNDIANIT